MKTLPMAQQTECGCTQKETTPQSRKNQLSKQAYMVRGAIILVGWYLLYSQLLPFSHFFTYTILGIEQSSHLGAAVQFFVYDAPKVLLLLTLVVFGIGIPMYSNAAGMVPIVGALLGKGAALGTVLAFMMSVIALSLPEMVILSKMLKPKLITTFILVVGCGILFTGYLFNLLI